MKVLSQDNVHRTATIKDPIRDSTRSTVFTRAVWKKMFISNNTHIIGVGAFVLATFLFIVTFVNFVYDFFFLLRNNSPTQARATSFLKFLDHSQWHTTVTKTPLDEWSARRIDIYCTTLTKDRHLCPRWDSNPQYQHASGCISSP
jgi:hypothetical protein